MREPDGRAASGLAWEIAAAPLGAAAERAVPGFWTASKLVMFLTVRLLLARKKLFFLLALIAVPAFITIVTKMAGEELTLGYPTLVPNATLLFLAPLLCLFQGGSVFGDDVDQKTIGYLLIRPVSRDAIYFGKFLGVALVSFALLAFSALACYLPAFYTDGIGSLFLEPNVSDFVNLLGVMALASMLYAALFMLLGLVMRHVMIAGIVYFVFIEVMFTWLYGPPSALALCHHLQRLLPVRFDTVERITLREMGRETVELVSRPIELAGLILVLAVLMAGGMAAARSNDFHARDDD
jgi:ABC-type transport system involved in multi-copper enzyme maturation permease subunit